MLFCWQQIWFHLSQITPRRQTIRLKESKSGRKTNQTTKNEYERLCQESLCEAIRNLQASTNADILEIPLRAIVNQKPVIGSHPPFTNSAISQLNRVENAIKMSYVSSSSFRENRAEPMLVDTQTPVVRTHVQNPSNAFLLTANLIHQLSQPMFRNAMQIRGFKTHRTIESQLKRNPSFLTRIQQSFGMDF